MAVSGLLWGASAAAARVASLNLCTDEYLLLLARPGDVVSITRLAQDPQESVLAKLARKLPANRGRLEDVIGARPTLILTMGGAGRSTTSIARALKLNLVDLLQPVTIGDVSGNLTRVAAALGDASRARVLTQRIANLQRSAPAARDAVWLGGGGLTLTPGSLSAQWLRLAGFQQRALPGGRVTLEALVTSPPSVLVTSRYRAAQLSAGQRWLQHPLLRALPSRRVTTDGRRWTCAGPLMIDEVERLRRFAR